MGIGDTPLAEYATSHGLVNSAARPTLSEYTRSLLKRRFFIWHFATSKSVSMYTDSKLGQIWQVLTPLLNATVYYFVFGVLLGRKGDVPDYISFLVIGIFVFTFTQRSFQQGAKAVQDNLNLIRALHFPRASLPFADTVVELQQLVISIGVMVVILLYHGEYPAWQWLMIVPVLLLQLMFNMGASLIMARLGAFQPDTAQLLPFLLRTWFYVSGVVFALWTVADKVSGWVTWVLVLNPGSVYVDLARRAMMPSYDHALKRNATQYMASCHKPTADFPIGTTAAKMAKVRTDGCRDYTTLMHMNQVEWWAAIGWAVVIFTLGYWYFWRAETRYGRG
jgi:teichoic acid transport system permease protein